MSDVLGWAVIVLILSVPVLFVVISVALRSVGPADETATASSGGLLGMDELFHPSAHEARVQWEAQQEIPAPAPTPDRGPGVIEPGGRIVLVVADRD